jgi:hypothetical protein
MYRKFDVTRNLFFCRVPFFLGTKHSLQRAWQLPGDPDELSPPHPLCRWQRQDAFYSGRAPVGFSDSCRPYVAMCALVLLLILWLLRMCAPLFNPAVALDRELWMVSNCVRLSMQSSFAGSSTLVLVHRVSVFLVVLSGSGSVLPCKAASKRGRWLLLSRHRATTQQQVGRTGRWRFSRWKKLSPESWSVATGVLACNLRSLRALPSCWPPTLLLPELCGWWNESYRQRQQRAPLLRVGVIMCCVHGERNPNPDHRSDICGVE